MSNLVERPVVDYKIEDIPFGAQHGNVQLQDPSKVRVLYPHRAYPTDIGSLAYTTRIPKGKHSFVVNTILVDIGSFNAARVPAIENILEEIFTLYFTSGNTSISVTNKTTNFMNFIEWCDSNNHFDVLSGKKPAARKAIKDYVLLLEHRIKVKSLSINSASAYQNHSIALLAVAIGVPSDELTTGIRLIIRDKKAINSISPPEDECIRDSLLLFEALFDGITNFIINNKKYPFLLELPKESVWIFPAPRWMATAEKIKARGKWKKPYWAWNYRDGRINTFDEIQHKYKYRSVTLQVIRGAETTLDNGNKDSRNTYRLDLAVWAHDAFAALFAANTGMNPKPMVGIKWDGNYEVGAPHQKTRSIKNRAGGGEQDFIIAREFLPRFKKFLKLREYLVGDVDHPFLFVGLECKSSRLPRAMETDVLGLIYNKIKRKIDPTIVNITAGEWRKEKADYLIKNEDPATTAMLLQHSVETTLGHYVVGSEKEAADEMSAYFAKLNDKIITTDKDLNTSIPAGGCSNPDHPTPENDQESIIKPDCKQFEGCLFCGEYSPHPDETDIRKLCSMAYVVRETAHLADSEAHHDEIFGATLRRIDSILDVMKSISEPLSEIVVSIKSDVDENENLDEYWESKLAMLVRIGAL